VNPSLIKNTTQLRPGRPSVVRTQGRGRGEVNDDSAQCAVRRDSALYSSRPFSCPLWTGARLAAAASTQHHLNLNYRTYGNQTLCSPGKG